MRALDFLHTTIKKSYLDKKSQLHSKTEAANLLLMTWAFVFGGIVGLYQAGILHSSNTQSIVLLLSVMFVSIFLCVISTILSDYEVSAPNITGLWREYCDAVIQNNANIQYYVQMKEHVTSAFITARALDQRSLEKKSKRLTAAAVILLVALLLLVFYVIFPDFKISIIVIQ